jgi:succinate dehydrogenase hydrophobic anchor subunit
MLYSAIVIEWHTVLLNGFWIAGLALLLAALSYHHWVAQQTSGSLHEQLQKPAFRQAFWLSFILVAVGLAGTSQRGWETAVWGIFVIIGLAHFIHPRLRNP